MAAADSPIEDPGREASQADRLTLAEIRVHDLELDLAAAASPFRLQPGVASPTAIAVCGLNGHLFISDGANRWERQYLGELAIPPGWIAAWRDLLARRQVEAARRGLELWNLIVPEKQVVLPEQRWPAPLPDGERRPVRALLAALAAEARVHYAADALAAAKAHGPVYFRSNSHWTPSGCCAALFGLLGEIGAPVEAETLRFAYRRIHAPHDLTPHLFERPPSEELGKLEPCGGYVFDRRTPPPGGRNTGRGYGLHNPDAPDPRRVIVFGDSFSFGAGLGAALSAVFRDLVFLWNKNVAWEEVEAHGADLVIWQSAERFLATHPQT